MIRYSPPKSQVWGHEVGRLPAPAIVDRALQFLDRECQVLSSPPSEFTLAQATAANRAAVDVGPEIESQLGPPSYAADKPYFLRRWTVTAKDLPLVAVWFDRLAADTESGAVVAHCSISWMFAWRDEPPPLHPLSSAGGMFGVHLARPRRITTMFTFRSIERYEQIKAALKQLDLAELSDRHLRPKTAGTMR